MFPTEPISAREFLLFRLRFLSSDCVPALEQQLGTTNLLEHPDFETEANKMINKITFYEKAGKETQDSNQNK